ncbi:4-aminobutyrate aminotransferase-like enzyme [Mycobacterium sp. URHB0021]
MVSKTLHMANAFDGSEFDRLDPEAQALIRRREAVLAPSYRLFYRHPVVAVRGSGVWLYDADGNQYLDAYNNVPAVGHSHPHVQRLVNDQLGLLNTHTRYLTEPVITYSERLLDLFPPELTKVVYTCTGSEAVDLALRIARYESGAEGVICTSHAYHGTTAAAAAISPSLGPNNRIGSDVALVAAPDTQRDDSATMAEDFADRVRRAISDLRDRGVGFAGMIVDSILSSDGVHSDPAGFLAPAARAVREAGGLWIADEVQPGFGRLGSTWWGFQRHEFVPDLAVMGKPMGNGVPIGAVAGREEVMAAFGRDIRYFNTFGGNPVSIAAATAVLDVIESERLLESVSRTGQTLIEGFNELATRHGCIGGVRGSGLFTAVEFVNEEDRKTPDAARASLVVNELRDRRILISASGPHENVLKIRPPLPFTTDHATQLLGELDDVLAGPAR